MTKTIPTVGVVIIKDAHVLLVVKDNHPMYAHQLPGGQIDAGEMPVDAACRELEETTGLLSSSKDYIKIPTEWRAVIKKDYGEAAFSFVCFVCKRYNGEARRTDSASASWVSLKDLGTMTLNPNTQNAINAAIDLIGE